VKLYKFDVYAIKPAKGKGDKESSQTTSIIKSVFDLDVVTPEEAVNITMLAAKEVMRKIDIDRDNFINNKSKTVTVDVVVGKSWHFRSYISKLMDIDNPEFVIETIFPIAVN
jgi:hypothetical protein